MTRGRSTTITFSFLTTLWIVLCLYFVGVTSALSTELYEHNFFIFFNSIDDRCKFNESFRDKFHRIIPVLSLGSMIAMWVFYVTIFIVNIIHSCFSRTSN